jgi:hypothetical protein
MHIRAIEAVGSAHAPLLVRRIVVPLKIVTRPPLDVIELSPSPISIPESPTTPKAGPVPAPIIHEPDTTDRPRLDMARASAIIRGEVASFVSGRAETLRQEALLAAAKGFDAGALTRCVELAELDPDTAGRLRFEPAMERLGPQLESALQRLIPAARVDAQSRLAQAAQLAKATEMEETAHILNAARTFFGKGTHGGYRRAARLAQVAIDYYTAVALRPTQATPSMRVRNMLRMRSIKTAAPQRLPTRFADRAVANLKRMWSRAPLLLLLLGWLAAGVIAGSAYRLVLGSQPRLAASAMVEGGFEIWALGFLALVGFGFWVRVRTVSFTP